MWVSKQIQERIDESKKSDGYWVENAKLEFAIELDRACKAAGLNGKALAEKYGKSAAYISKVFRGDANLTLETMIKLARAAGANIEVNFVPQIEAIKPVEVSKVTNNVIGMPSAFLGRVANCPAPSNAGAWVKNVRFDPRNFHGEEVA